MKDKFGRDICPQCKHRLTVRGLHIPNKDEFSCTVILFKKGYLLENDFA